MIYQSYDVNMIIAISPLLNDLSDIFTVIKGNLSGPNFENLENAYSQK